MEELQAVEQSWSFLTTHARVLVCIASEHRTRLRDIAASVGITERAVQAIVNDLADAGYLTRHRAGTRNYYEIHPDTPLRHPAEQSVTAGELVALALGKRTRR